MTLTYKLLNTDGRARRGEITMPRGVIQTPVFMPVGTAATVKGMMPRDLEELGTQISLANTYHLHIQPGEALVQKAGGLHKFMAMPWPILTDSGGFQVFSLPKKELSEEGVLFEFKKGAKPIFATPEWSMQVQQALGADIMMAFDECAPYPCTEEHAERAMERTLRWLDRCKASIERTDQYLFGIVQGSVFERLRRRSAEETQKRDLPGYAIGGVSVGEGHSLMMKAIDDAEPYMPVQKPRYLMGVGLPEDIVGAVGRGVDMFDCVIPTRYGRSGTCFTRRGRIRLTDRAYRNDMYPIDPQCSCYACRNYSRAYIHHLLKSDEILGTMMCTLHNVGYYHDLMKDIRAALDVGKYTEFCDAFEREYVAGDRERRRVPFEPGLFASFDVGWATRRAHDEEVMQRETAWAKSNAATRDDASIGLKDDEESPSPKAAAGADATRSGTRPAGPNAPKHGTPAGGGKPSSWQPPKQGRPGAAPQGGGRPGGGASKPQRRTGR